MNKPIAAIILLCLVSFFFSSHKPFAFEGIFMLLTYIGAYFVTVSSVRTRKQQRTLVYVIVSTAILLSVIGILKRFDMNPFSWWIYPEIHLKSGSNYVSGTYVNRNHLAGFLEMAIPFLLVLFITRKRSLETKLGMVFLALFLLITQSFTLSRGGWISTISTLIFIAVVLFVHKKSFQKRIIAIIGISAVVISLFIISSLPVIERVTTLTQQDQAVNLTGRIQCWKGVVNQISDNLFFGTGPNTFKEAYPAWQIPGTSVLRRYAHNDYLHFMSETGILFVPVLIYTLVCFFRSGFQNIKSQSRQKMGFALGAMAGVFAILIHSFSDFNLNIPANALVFTVIAGTIKRKTRNKNA